MKILWHGVGSTLRTGYGTQTSLFVPALIRAGHDVAINACLNQYHTGTDKDGVVNFATGMHSGLVGNHLIAEHHKRFKPDCVISMIDAWICKPEIFDKFNWHPFVMVDSEPLLWENAEVLKAAKKCIAPTRYAQRILREAGFDSYYVPLAFDGDVFKPEDRKEARAEMGRVWDRDLDGKFVVVVNAANNSQPSRKNFPATIKAFADFHSTHPDSILYLHTDMRGQAHPIGGEDLIKVMKLYGAEEDSIIFAPQYEYITGLIGSDYLCDMYNAADVYLCTSRGEGFGLPLVEAQACGCPVIVPDFGAMAELGLTGSKCGGRRFMYQPGTEQILVNEEEVTSALHYHYETNDSRAILTSAVVQDYEIDNVFENSMKPMLLDIAGQQRGRTSPPPCSRKEST